MKIRVYTEQTFLDIEVVESFEKKDLLKAIDDGSTIALEMTNGNLFIINTMLVIGLEIFTDTPHKQD